MLREPEFSDRGIRMTGTLLRPTLRVEYDLRRLGPSWGCASGHGPPGCDLSGGARRADTTSRHIVWRLMAHAGVIVVLALRNLRRHLRRTLLTAAAMVVGGAMLMFALSLGDGTHEQWIDSGVRTGSGHVTVEHPEFRLSRRIEDDCLRRRARPSSTHWLRRPSPIACRSCQRSSP